MVPPVGGITRLGLRFEQDNDILRRQLADRGDAVPHGVVRGRVGVVVPVPLGLRHLGPEVIVDRALPRHHVVEEEADPHDAVLLRVAQAIRLHQPDEILLGPAFGLVLDAGGAGVDDPPVVVALLGELGEAERPQGAELQQVPFERGHGLEEAADDGGTFVGDGCGKRGL